MEALAAISLVGSIIQFVDFGSKLISKSVQLYRSSDGVLAENIDTEVATDRLVLLNNKLRGPANTAGEVALENLCISCSNVAVELLGALDKLKVQGGQRRWKSIRKAIRSVWSKEDVQEIEKRLASLREELTLHVVVDLRERICQAKLEQPDLLKGLDVVTQNIILAIENQHDFFQAAVHTQIASIGAQVADARAGITQEIKLLKLDENLAEQERRLAALHIDDAAFNSRLWEHEPRCLPETRVDLLQQIITWSEDPSGSCMFWLNGMASTGKSTIARTATHVFANQKRLGASFFFSRGQRDLDRAGKFFTTLAAQLAHTLPALKPYIYGAMAENFNIASSGESLRSQILIFVVDALDECEDDRDVRLILQLLAEVEAVKTIQTRVFITSRPETPIRLGFRAMPGVLHHDLFLHDVPRAVIDDDISTFFRYKFEEIRDEFEDVPVDWPGEHNINLLVRRAGGLFIYAATVCQFIKGDQQWPPQDLLSLFLPGDTTSDSSAWDPTEITYKSPTWELDRIYLQVLEYSFKKIENERDRPKLAEMFRKVVGSIVILSEPLSATALARLLSVPKHTVNIRLRHLHSVLHASESQGSPIRILHPSFRDFLLDKQRCHNPQFWVDERKTHDALAKSCLELMSKNLKRDMCNLRLPGVLAIEVEKSKVGEHLPLDVQYACRYWVYHLRHDNSDLCDNGQVHAFLGKHFLHWLEALSLLGNMSDGAAMVRTLESVLTLKSNSRSLLPLVYDAKCFILNHKFIIEKAPLQIYCSALVFSPKKNPIRAQYWDQAFCWVANMSIVQDWNSSPQVLEGHLDYVNAVAFSPDGQLLASTSDDTTVGLWDPTTGVLRCMLKGHRSWVLAVAFSPDSQLLASASGDRTVRLWGPTTGAPLHILEGHSESVSVVAFSPDSRLLASASGDKTVRLWDPTTGALLHTLKGHSEPVSAVAFSPGSELLASASGDKTVRLWDPMTGAFLFKLEGHLNNVNAVAFSPDGQLLASTSDDRTVRLWDPVAGVLRRMLEGHSEYVGAVAFSPDGQLLASASADRTVRLWDPTTGVSCGTLKGHSSWVSAVAFSPNGKLFASASRDKMIVLWDPAAGVSRCTLEGHSDWVSAVAFSPDSQLLASASNDRTVRLWDPTTVTSGDTLTGHPSWVRVVAFSPDGQLLASASVDRTIILWDPTTGASLHTLQGHSDFINAVAFSPDGQLLASASDDKTVRLWNPTTGGPLHTLEGHSDCVNAVAFSPDGQLLASASDDTTVGLWDPTTGVLRCMLEDHLGHVNALAFSPDGRLLASASGDKTVRLWSPAIGASCGMLKVHSGRPTVVAFSLDSHFLASASSVGTIGIWNIKTKEMIRELNASNVVSELSFTNDGLHLVIDRGVLKPGLPILSEGQFQSDPPPHLYVNGHWVVYDKKNIFWLPPSYRAYCSCARANILALGHESGQVTFLEFQLNSIPRGA